MVKYGMLYKLFKNVLIYLSLFGCHVMSLGGAKVGLKWKSEVGGGDGEGCINQQDKIYKPQML